MRPNPADATVYIAAEVVDWVKLYALDGRLLLNSKGNDINISSLSPGLYLVVFSADGKVHREQLIKSK
jgi:hypothetical protein